MTIYVVYDLPVKIYNPDDMYLRLALSPFVRTASYVGLVNDTSLEFLYIVQSGDTSAVLDLVDSSSFELEGALIYRLSNSNTTLADSVVPVGTTTGSLALQKSININTASPLLLTMEVLNSAGTYTAGDNIDIKLTFDTDIFILDSPRLWLENSQKSLDAYVRTAPANPDFTHARAEPGKVAQLEFSFQVNYALWSGQTIEIYLPGLKGGIDGSSTPVTMYVGGGNSSEIGTATWTPSSQQLNVTLSSAIPSKTKLVFVIEGRNGLVLPSTGVLGASNSLSFDLDSHITRNFTQGLGFTNVDSVGLFNASVAISPSVAGADTELYITWTSPRPLEVGDWIELYLPNFGSPSGGIVVDQMRGEFNLTWNVFTKQLRLTTISPINRLMNSVNVTLTSPSTGLDAGDVLITTNFSSSGSVVNLEPPYMTKVCAFTDTTLEFINKTADSMSDWEFVFTLGPTAISGVSTVLLKLSSYDTTIVTNTERDLSSYLSGASSSDWTVVGKADLITFTYVGSSADGAQTLYMSSEAGYTVPRDGIISGDTFSVKMESSFAFKVCIRMTLHSLDPPYL